MKRVRWRRTIWVAIYAVLLNTLAPLVSNSIAAHRASASHEHCDDADGDAAAQHPASGHGSTLPDSDHFGHCPYCAPHGASFAVPPTTPFAIAVIGVPQRHLQRATGVAHLVEPWHTAHPRAPPLSS